MPKPAMMRPNTRPIMPVPTTPTVLPCRSKPSSPCSEKSPSRVRATARGRRRFSARIRADRMFGDRVRRVGRHPRDRDAETFGRGEVDVIEARRAQRDHARAAGMQTLEHGGVDVVVDERAHHFVAAARGWRSRRRGAIPGSAVRSDAYALASLNVSLSYWRLLNRIMRMSGSEECVPAPTNADSRTRHAGRSVYRHLMAMTAAYDARCENHSTFTKDHLLRRRKRSQLKIILTAMRNYNIY